MKILNENQLNEAKKVSCYIMEKIVSNNVKNDEITNIIYDFLEREINKINITDELFKKLPAMVSLNGDYYHFYLLKGTNRIIVGYKMNTSEGGRDLYNTYRSGNTLTEALTNMLKALIEWDLLDKNSNILLDMIKHSEKNEK